MAFFSHEGLKYLAGSTAPLLLLLSFPHLSFFRFASHLRNVIWFGNARRCHTLGSAAHTPCITRALSSEVRLNSSGESAKAPSEG